MNQNERKTVLHRMLLLIAVACVIMGLYAMRLIFLQLVNGDDFKAKATNTTDYNFTVTAARGDIVDSAGRRIATTATSYNVVLNKLLMGTAIWTPCCSRSWSCCGKTARAGTIPCSSASRTQQAAMPLQTMILLPAIRSSWQI